MSGDSTPLARLYEFMRVMSLKERLELAGWIAENPSLLGEWSRRSLKSYCRTFSNADESFHPARPELPPAESVTDCRTGRNVAILLADHPRGRWWNVNDAPELDFRFVDYELAPHRKTAGARLQGELASGPGMRADVLLVGREGIPIIGEIKAATETGHDTDPVLALIQGVTACAQLLSPQQMERLENAYPFAQFRAAGALDLFVIVVKPELAARATYQADLYDAAKALAPILAQQPGVPARRIAFIEARYDGRLELRLAALGVNAER
jgi:hypothetical protein